MEKKNIESFKNFLWHSELLKQHSKPWEETKKFYWSYTKWWINPLKSQSNCITSTSASFFLFFSFFSMFLLIISLFILFNSNHLIYYLEFLLLIIFLLFCLFLSLYFFLALEEKLYYQYPDNIITYKTWARHFLGFFRLFLGRFKSFHSVFQDFWAF